MSRLLRADFARLRRNKAFWIGAAVMMLYGVTACISQYRTMVKYDVVIMLEEVFFSGYMIVGVVQAAFCSLFLGTEYSDGVMRNKLVVGGSREKIYFSNFLACAAAGLLFNLSYHLVVCTAGIPLFGFFQTEPRAVLGLLLTGTLMTVTFSAIFTLLGMLIQNKAMVSTVSLIGVFVALFIASYLMSMIGMPEFMDDIKVVDGVFQNVERIANPNFLRGTKRQVYEFLLDFLPNGQAVQIGSLEAQNLGRMLLCSAGIIIGTGTAGILAFRKKDLK